MIIMEMQLKVYLHHSLQTIYRDKSTTMAIDDKVDSDDTKTSEWAADGIITCLHYNPDQ